MKARLFIALTLALGLVPQNSYPMFGNLAHSFKNTAYASFSSLYLTLNEHKIATAVGCIGVATGIGYLLYTNYFKKRSPVKPIKQEFYEEIQTKINQEYAPSILYSELWKLGATRPNLQKRRLELIEQLKKNVNLDSLEFEIKKGQSNYLYIKSDLLNLQGRTGHSLMDFHRSKKSDQEYKINLANNYKIHLMPKSNEDFIFLFEHLLNAIQSNSELASKTAAIKFHIGIKFESLETIISSLQKNPHEIYPAIVIYPTSSKDDAEFILNYLYKNFKDMPGLDVSPRYNIKATSLIYYAQGDGDYKGESCESRKDYTYHDLTGYYERHEGYDDDMALYKPDFVQEGINLDYRLHIDE